MYKNEGKWLPVRMGLNECDVVIDFNGFSDEFVREMNTISVFWRCDPQQITKFRQEVGLVKVASCK